MSKEYFNAYHKYLEWMSTLSDSEKGRLFVACLAYSEKGILPKLPGNEKLLFPSFKIQIDKDKELNSRRAESDGCIKGDLHWNWKGGITPQNQIGRSSRQYKEWRSAVFKRDNYTCSCCGAVGGNLNAHHIEPWSANIEKRYDVNNGVTLCAECHKAAHGR